MNRKILIVVAMESEALPLCDRLGLTRLPAGAEAPAPFVTFAGRHGNLDIRLAWNGRDTVHGVDNIGTQASVLTTFLSLQEFRPELVLNIGTAGGFASQGTHVGDILLSHAPVIFHGRRIALQEFAAYGVGSFPSLDGRALAQHLGIRSGIVSSGDSFDHDERELAYIRQLGGNAVEMEAAAIAWVCSLFQVPFLALKLIVNLVDGPEPAHEEFLRNLHEGCAALRDVTVRLLEQVENQPLDAWGAAEKLRKASPA